MADPIPVSALQVAESLILEGERRGVRDMTARKLQKLIYLTQVYHLTLYGTAAFLDCIKAWEDGPVVPGVWHEFKAGRPPNQPITSKDVADPGKSDAVFATNDPLRDVVQKVLGDFGRYTPDRLIEITHGQKPWIRAWENAKSGGSDRIAEDDIAALAKKLARHLTHQFRPSFLQEIEKLHHSSGDARFVLGKMTLASAAGELSEALLLGAQKEKLVSLRQKLKEAAESISDAAGEPVPRFNLPEKSDLDQFAVELTEFAMEHRVR
ncbi:MAG: hypothetical protein QG602_572 [Verrucomicrobiota bacterium]|nr:hypothetical protein [Verrucomicrobiota bacterium]